MGSSGEAAYLEALKQEEPLSNKSCGADVQVGMPAGGRQLWCRCQAVRWRLKCCDGSCSQALLTG